MKVEVLMNGEPFAKMPRAMAESYVRAQLRKVRGAGVAAVPPPEDKKAYAARQRWEIRG